VDEKHVVSRLIALVGFFIGKISPFRKQRAIVVFRKKMISRKKRAFR
jgi:hypothetical protein